MTRSQRELLRWVREQLENIEAEIDEWMDEERTYTPAERNLAVRLDCRPVPA